MVPSIYQSDQEGAFQTNHTEIEDRFPKKTSNSRAQVAAVLRIAWLNKNILCVTGFAEYFQKQEFYNFSCGQMRVY